MKAVITAFEDDVIDDQNTACHSNGQTGYVNEGKYFVTLDVSQRDLDIIFQHDGLLGLWSTSSFIPERDSTGLESAALRD